MQTVNSGGTITFYQTFTDSEGATVDPSSITFRIAKNVTSFLSGTFTYDPGDIQRNVLGVYFIEYQTTIYSTPGIYNARWDVTIDNIEQTFIEPFQIIELQPTANSILDAPRTYGVMMESSLYRTLGQGETDRLFLIGHASGLPLNFPYQVNNMQEAVNLLGAGAESPLLRGLLECYNSGARDIWLVAAAPEIEYVPYDYTDPEARFVQRTELDGQNFYERYYDRLAVTYALLEQYDLPEIIVPLHAPYFETRGVDFVGQLVQHCEDSFATTSVPRIGVIGTCLGDFSVEKIQELIDFIPADEEATPRDYGFSGKFVMVVQGEGVFNLPQMPTTYVAPVTAAAASRLASSPLNIGLTYRPLPQIQKPVGRPLTKLEYRALSAKKVNPLIEKSQGRRGNSYQSVLASDNTLASDGSDYWAITQMRLVMKVIQQIQNIGQRALGTIGYPQFKLDVNNYLTSLTIQRYIKNYSLLIERDTIDRYKAIVDVSLYPYSGIREILFQVRVGPGV